MNPLESDRVFIIAEAGVNHNGRPDLAFQLVDVAVAAGADAVKFQTFKAEKLASRKAEKAEYQKGLTDSNESQFAMLKKLELSDEMHHRLIDYCQQKGILFLSSPFDEESAEQLYSLGLEIFKIPSGEITNLPYLRRIGSFKKKIILSTGMSSLQDVLSALNVLVDAGTEKKDITLLHVNTEYPTPFSDVHLRAMPAMGKTFGVRFGYSDHTPGIEVPIAAVAMGAKVIEKHFTLDKEMEGPDHKASLSPQELQQMVLSIRHIELALGLESKKPSESESKNIAIARKSLVAKRKIKKGELLTTENLVAKRPGHGLSPMLWDRLIGTPASQDFEEDDLIC